MVAHWIPPIEEGALILSSETGMHRLKTNPHSALAEPRWPPGRYGSIPVTAAFAGAAGFSKTGTPIARKAMRKPWFTAVSLPQ
jgi:hypothetical protein